MTLQAQQQMNTWMQMMQQMDHAPQPINQPDPAPAYKKVETRNFTSYKFEDENSQSARDEKQPQ